MTVRNFFSNGSKKLLQVPYKKSLPISLANIEQVHDHKKSVAKKEHFAGSKLASPTEFDTNLKFGERKRSPKMYMSPDYPCEGKATKSPGSQRGKETAQLRRRSILSKRSALNLHIEPEFKRQEQASPMSSAQNAI